MLIRDADGKLKSARSSGENWSGEATRKGGNDEQRVDITIGDNAVTTKTDVRKEVPVWMTKSTIMSETTADSSDSIPGVFTEEVHHPIGQRVTSFHNQRRFVAIRAIH